jgi:uncharacterized protein
LTPPLLPDAGSPADPASQLGRARTSLRQTLNRYSAYLRSQARSPLAPALDLGESDLLRRDMERLRVTLSKLNQQLVRVAVFGLVSRGKSAVLNALLGQKILPTGPLNGVTQTPRSVLWSVEAGDPALQVELIDTPGLDEIDGQARAEMAQEIAAQADLILFVVSGDITRTEYQALCDLRQAQKPLLLVFNKIDLYPDRTRQAIYANLQQLGTPDPASAALQQLLSAHEIVLVAAEPASLQVRVEQADGQVSYEWETPPPQVQNLKQKIQEILQQEGRSLLAVNALTQARDAEATLASKTLELRHAEAEALIWQFVRYKSIAIGLNPIAGLDLIGGFVSDLAMIRSLSELYGLPVTRHEAGKLWKTILLSSGSLLAAELGSGLLFSLGKGGAAIASGLDSSTSFSTIVGAAIVQSGIAGYGTYTVGRAIQVYLERGCSWGAQGASAVVEEILAQVPPSALLHRLRQELGR